MPVLTMLKLHFTDPKDPHFIDLTPYFNTCPESVKSFDIDCFEVEFDPQGIRKCYIESINVTCSALSPELFNLVPKCLPASLHLKLAGSIGYRTGFVLRYKHPLEEFTCVLDRRKTVASTYKDNRTCDYYLCNSEGTRLAT